jgi:hypothetical protein
VAIAAYVLVLCVWVLFLAPALRGSRGERAIPAAAAVLGILGALREIWLTFAWGPSASGPIRVDIFLVFWLLAAVYGMSALRIWRAGWIRTAALAGGVTGLACAGMAAAWVASNQEIARLDALRDEGNQLLFEARFANRAAYERAFAFGMGGNAADVPAGHWAPESGSGIAYTRFIVNPSGHAFLFFGCGPTECLFGPGAPLRAAEGGTASGWTAALAMRGVGERSLTIAPPAGDALVVDIDGKPARFRRTPPPLLDRQEDENLAYLGAFSAAERVRQHARVSQIWLWRSDAELLAVGIFRYLLPGQRADFVAPVVLGRGSAEDGRWRFRWEENERAREALVRILEGGVEIDLPGEEHHWPPHSLALHAIFRDPAIELAPLTSVADWEHWFEVQLTAHFSSGEVPEL